MLNNWLNRTTKVIHYNVDASDMTSLYGGDFSSYASNATWLYDPDLTAVAGQPVKYWIITGDVVTLMDQAAMDVVDAAELEAQRDAAAAELDQVENILRSFMLIVLDELNILRGNDGLADRTVAQLRNAIRGKLGS